MCGVIAATIFDRTLAMKTERVGHRGDASIATLRSSGNDHHADHKFDFADLVLSTLPRDAHTRGSARSALSLAIVLALAIREIDIKTSDLICLDDANDPYP
jgi:hypothetical protein